MLLLQGSLACFFREGLTHSRSNPEHFLDALLEIFKILNDSRHRFLQPLCVFVLRLSKNDKIQGCPKECGYLPEEIN